MTPMWRRVRPGLYAWNGWVIDHQSVVGGPWTVFTPDGPVLAHFPTLYEAKDAVAAKVAPPLPIPTERCANCTALVWLLVDDLLCIRCDSLLWPSTTAMPAPAATITTAVTTAA